MTFSPSFLYFVVPLGLWYQFGLSPHGDLQRQWRAIRRRIALLYLPAVIFDLIVLGLETRRGELWGLLPYFVGLGLIFWGYAALERQARSGTEAPKAGGAEAVSTVAKLSAEGLADHKVM